VYDQDVNVSIRKRRPLVLENPGSRAAQCVAEIASKLAKGQQMPFAPLKGRTENR
jgi:MinD-like ATPase involved in chromosome partitioning or flagellar assembly